MSTAKKLFKSSVSRTSLTIVQMIIAFFLMPFMIGQLGDQWYGIWTIIGSLMGYYYLVDFGLAAAVMRYVSKYIAKNDSHNTNVIINTSLVIYCIMALTICVLTVIVSYFAGCFIADTSSLKMVRIVIIILGFNLALEFPFKAFAGIVRAYIRYDLLTYSHFFTLILSTGLIVYFLNRGHGILTLSLIMFGCSQISNLLFFAIARYLFRTMQFGWKYVSKERIRELFNYSIWSFLIQISDQLRFRIDFVVIGWMLTASHVTLYFIGARLVEYFFNLILRATNILTPVFTRYHTEGSYAEIRDKLLFFTKINTILAIFGGGLITILGKPFIIRWMGDKYTAAYYILVILIISMVFELINMPSQNVLLAISKHRYLAIVNIVEGMSNMILSIVLINYYGIVGVALGTAIPLTISRIFIVPAYVCRCTKLSKTKYFLSILPALIISIAYLSVFYYITRNILLIPEYGSLLIAAVVAVPLYLVSVFFIFNKSERDSLVSVIYSSLHIKKVS